MGFEDPESGDRPVDDVLYRDELYQGPYVDLAPDMFVQPTDLWAFAHTDALTEATDWPSGAHRRTGVLSANGGEVSHGTLPMRRIEDVPATALAFSGVSTEGMGGDPLGDIAQGSTMEPVPASDLPAQTETPGLSEEDQEHITQHLRDLGYIE